MKLSIIRCDDSVWEAAVVDDDGNVVGDVHRALYHEIPAWALAQGITVDQLPRAMQPYADPGYLEREFAAADRQRRACAGVAVMWDVTRDLPPHTFTM